MGRNVKWNFQVSALFCGYLWPLQAKLAAVSADLADEKTKTQALSRERDAALQTARGGSLRQRIKRSAKWFLVGVAVGAVAAKAH